MAKRGSNQKSGNRNPKKMKVKPNVDFDDMDDEVDLFHKQNDKIPLDMDDDSAESDEDDEQPVFDYKGASDDDSEEEEDSEDDDDDEDKDDEEKYDKSLAKLERTQKYLKAKHGNLEDDLIDDATEDTEEKRTVWGRKKSIYHDADNIDFELQSSDEGSAEEEEAEVIRLRKETAKSMTMEDFGVEVSENDKSDAEPTLEEIMSSKRKETADNLGITYEEVKKDLSSLSKDEQMDVVSSSAPELFGLLSELNDALSQLDQINPIVTKIKLKLQKDTVKKEELHCLEVKKLLLLAYCQAITFYLLLKSEGQPVRDHPCIVRLVEIKSLLDKTKVLDEHLPSQLEVFFKENEAEMNSAGIDSITLDEQPSVPNDINEPIAMEPLKAKKSRTMETVKKELQNVKGQNKHKPNEAISVQSLKMLSTRAALEEKLKQKGIFTTLDSKSQTTQKYKLQHNSQLETFDDFGDDVVDVEGNKPSLLTNKISQLINTQGNKHKVSGDEDLPRRDDLGERRRKHELRVLSRAGVEPTNDEDNILEDAGESGNESEDELINLQEAKLASKSSITPAIPLELETVDGKRLISQQMEKNRGLTPHRKKLTKNPRKKYKLKHEKAKKRHTGQVRQIRKPEGPYGGEMSGINAGVSRSIRFKG